MIDWIHLLLTDYNCITSAGMVLSYFIINVIFFMGN